MAEWIEAVPNGWVGRQSRSRTRKPRRIARVGQDGLGVDFGGGVAALETREPFGTTRNGGRLDCVCRHKGPDRRSDASRPLPACHSVTGATFPTPPGHCARIGDGLDDQGPGHAQLHASRILDCRDRRLYRPSERTCSCQHCCTQQTRPFWGHVEQAAWLRPPR